MGALSATQLTLVVLAAGIGSRFGGAKQLEAVGPSGEILLDYSIYDAIRAGFQQVVFVIRRELERDFLEKVVKKYESRVNVRLVFQEIQDLPAGRICRVARTKPWGTGHALWCVRDVVDSPFLVINADDFYGASCYELMAKQLKQCSDAQQQKLQMYLVAFPLKNTLSEHGSVSRGVCWMDSEYRLIRVEEYRQVELAANGSIVGIAPSGEKTTLDKQALVSMNFWGFFPSLFVEWEKCFSNFLDNGGLQDENAEFFIPSAVTEILSTGKAVAKVLKAEAPWFGITYRQDVQHVRQALYRMVCDGQYTSPLW